MTTQMGTRYRCPTCGAEFLVTRPGELPTCDGAALEPLAGPARGGQTPTGPAPAS